MPHTSVTGVTPADTHTHFRAHDRSKRGCPLHARSSQCYCKWSSHVTVVLLTVNCRAGAARTRLHPVWHSTTTRPANHISTRPSPIPRPHAAGTAAAVLLKASNEFIHSAGGLSLDERCRLPCARTPHLSTRCWLGCKRHRALKAYNL